MHFHIITLFPEFFSSPLSCGLMAKAVQAGRISFSFHNPRDFSDDKHRHTDDTPYGGGVGMVMQIAPIARTIRSIEKTGPLLFLTPSGRPFTQKRAEELAKEEHITLICARYEGIDARIESLFSVQPISLCDVVLNSGDTAALAVIEACARLVPGFMGKGSSAREESFAENLLEYPQYTRPPVFEGVAVPDILLTGHHAKIAAWRRAKALVRTRRMRPDLLDGARLTAADAASLAEERDALRGRNLSFCLVHSPVRIDGKASGTSSLTNLDVHDIARISASYGLGPFFVVTPLSDQQEILSRILDHWLRGPAARSHPDRAEALRLVEPARTIEEACDKLATIRGERPFVIASSAQWSGAVLGIGQVRELLDRGPVLLCLGTAQGLADAARRLAHATVRPLRFLGYNHLSVRSAAAVYADRIVGDFD
ncbi:MAG: tRNA (guanosine(37)-N1)-methyltransferase TrmD [Desulfovibrionaceae bacterium]|nr:tRNA (guanosine(37)-N1)-methyltransferase TrmD [Desulfovibrionaceae bacterium]